jgi:nitrogen-specific signal transduction histidine kinase/DNA-binding NarL/FixJ family response regulator
MKTLLTIAPGPELAAQLRAGLNPEEFKVVHRATVEEAEPLLAHRLADACLLDVENTNVQAVWMLERLRRRNARCPVIVIAGESQPDWAEAAYTQGADFVLEKPVRIRVIEKILTRLLARPAADFGTSIAASTTATPASLVPPAPEHAVSGLASVPHTLSLLRDFSCVLNHSLNAEALLKQFLLLLREILGINRAAIFLRQPGQAFADPAAPEARRLRSVCSVGITPGLLEHFELSLEAGIGAQVLSLGRILCRDSEEARRSIETQKEFEILGSRVAIPIMNRDTLIGLAVFDGRITGEPLLNAELELVFHLLEQVALGVHNIWLHDQMAANNDLLAGALRELGSACVVINGDLRIVHANKLARKLFGESTRQTGDLEFTDLPPVLATKIHQVLRTGAAATPFRYEPEKPVGAVYTATIVPFQRQASGAPGSVLLTVEDHTQSELLRKLEVETSNLRLIKNMADRLVTEIGNAMVPISTHQQLLSEKYRDAEFRASLENALAEGVKRVTRLVNTMRFLAMDSPAAADPIPLGALIEEAFQEARKFQPGKASQLNYLGQGQPASVTGDRAALKHALAEVMINALQANPTDPKVGVKLETLTANNSAPSLRIEVEDNGQGFSPEIAEKATAPFYTNRVVGLGLGLTVCRKIIENHRGKLEILPPQNSGHGVIRISLPLTGATNDSH